MEIKFERTFFKDLNNIKDKKTATSVKNIITKLENASDIRAIPNLKKMKGHPTAYRIKAGDYRLGIFIAGNLIEIVRFLHRKEIYRFFP